MRDSDYLSDPSLEQLEHIQEQLDKRTLERQIQDSPSTSDKGRQMEEVEVDKISTLIDLSSDFDDPKKYNVLYREAQMLGQMQPALSWNVDIEVFHSWDQANRIGHYSPDHYIRGYADVYHSYYGDEAIALTENRTERTGF